MATEENSRQSEDHQNVYSFLSVFNKEWKNDVLFLFLSLFSIILSSFFNLSLAPSPSVHLTFSRESEIWRHLSLSNILNLLSLFFVSRRHFASSPSFSSFILIHLPLPFSSSFASRPVFLSHQFYSRVSVPVCPSRTAASRSTSLFPASLSLPSPLFPLIPLRRLRSPRLL